MSWLFEVKYRSPR